MKKTAVERTGLSGKGGKRRASIDASSHNPPSARTNPHEGRGFTRAPGRKATLDLALLGLIAEVPGVSGYDLMKIFDLSMTHYWHAHPTQIYPTLERMEEFGLIKRRNVVQRNRPNKRLYTITPKGERALVDWLESPFEGINLKHPPLLRCRFLGHLGPDGAIGILEEERMSWGNHLKLYRDIEKNYFADGKGYSDVNAMFTMFTLKRGIDWMEENIQWCDWAIGEIKRNRALFPAENMREGLPPIVSVEESIRQTQARANQQAAQRVEVSVSKHSKGSRPYPKELDW